MLLFYSIAVPSSGGGEVWRDPLCRHHIVLVCVCTHKLGGLFFFAAFSVFCSHPYSIPAVERRRRVHLHPCVSLPPLPSPPRRAFRAHLFPTIHAQARAGVIGAHRTVACMPLLCIFLACTFSSAPHSACAGRRHGGERTTRQHSPFSFAHNKHVAVRARGFTKGFQRQQ